MAFDFEPSIILETAPQLLGGMKLTLIITLGGLLVGLLLGVVTGLANTSRSRFLRGIAILYIEAIRGTPLIVQVMFLYFGLPLALGMRIPPDVAGVIAIGVNSGRVYRGNRARRHPVHRQGADRGRTLHRGSRRPRPCSTSFGLRPSGA